MNIHKAAELLKIHPATLSRMLHAKEVAGRKERGIWRVTEATVNKLLATRYEHSDEWIDASQVGELINKSPKVVRRLIRDGEIEARIDPLCRPRKFWVNRQKLEPMIRILKEK